MSALTKDVSIWRFLAALAERLDSHDYQIIDHWDADLFAVGVASVNAPGRLVYVSTSGQAPGRYAYECEEPRREQEYCVAEGGDGVSLDRLVDVVRRHLIMTQA